MAYLSQLYRQENSLKCRLPNKLSILWHDIHITINEERECVADETLKKKRSQRQKKGGLGTGNLPFEAVWPGSTVKYTCWCRLAYKSSSFFCAYGLTRDALCHRGCLSEWMSDTPGFDIMTGRPPEIFTTRANGLTFFFFMDFLFSYGFYGFLRNINLRSRLTILSNLNSMGR